MPKNNPKKYFQTGGATKKRPVKTGLRPGAGAGPPQGKFVQGRDASEIQKEIIEAIKLQMIGNQLFVTPEGGKGLDASSFIKQNPDFRPGNQPDLDQFQGAGFFPDFALPVDPNAPVPAPAPQTLGGLPQRAGGGSIPATGGKDNPFGGLRMPAEELIQQFAFGGPVAAGTEHINLTFQPPGNEAGAAANQAAKTASLAQPKGNPLGAGFADQARRQAKSGGARNAGRVSRPSGGGSGGGGAQPARGVQRGGGGGGVRQGRGGSGGGGGTNIGNFNPLSGAAGDTLNQTIQTGNPTDTAALAQSNADVNARAFQGALGNQNEALGALGLGSSSVRDSQNQALLNDFQLQTAQQNNQLGFQAGEAAANRSLAAFNPFLQGSGQTLQGGIAQGGFDTQTGINQANIGSNQLMQTRGFDQQNAFQGQQQNFQAQQQNAQNQFQADLFGAQNNQFQNPISGGGGVNLGGRAGVSFASGGAVDEFARGGAADPSLVRRSASGGDRVNRDDFISQQAFGQNFDRPGFQFDRADFSGAQRSGQPTSGGSPGGSGLGVARNTRSAGQQAEDADRLRQGQERRSLDQQKELMEFQRRLQAQATQQGRSDILGLASQLGAAQGGGGNQILGINGNVGAAQGLGLAALRANAGVFGLSDAVGGAGFQGADLSQLGGSSARQGRGEQQTADIQTNQQNQIAQFLINQGINPRTGQRLQTGGQVLDSEAGEIPGPAVPPDQVPIMASGGEGIVPPDVMGALDNFSGDPQEAVAIVSAMRDIMDFAPGPRGPVDDGGQGPQNAQTGLNVQGAPQGQVLDPFDFGGTHNIGTGDPFGAAGPGNAAQFNPSFTNADLGAASQPGGVSSPPTGVTGAPRDFQTEIANLTNHVDVLRSLAVKDGNRNTQLRRELLPQAQQQLQSLQTEFDLDRQRQEEAVRAQAAMVQAQSQQDFADTAVQRANIEATGRVDAAEASNFDPLGVSAGGVGGGGGQGPVNPEQIALMVSQGQMSEEQLLVMQQTNPELFQQVMILLGAQGGAQQETRPGLGVAEFGFPGFLIRNRQPVE